MAEEIFEQSDNHNIGLSFEANGDLLISQWDRHILVDAEIIPAFIEFLTKINKERYE